MLLGVGEVSGIDLHHGVIVMIFGRLERRHLDPFHPLAANVQVDTRALRQLRRGRLQNLFEEHQRSLILVNAQQADRAFILFASQLDARILHDFQDSRRGGVPGFQQVYELLSGMEFYTPDPEMMRNELDTTGSADILDADGENTASVLDRLSHTQEATKARIDQYLQAIVPGLERVEAEEFRSYKLLNFYLAVAGSAKPNVFLASAMSDGTLRALVLLVALFHNAGSDTRVSLIGIEEPEAGLHPAATAVLLGAIREASESVQVVVTSHSTDLLDNPEIPGDAIRAVSWENGQSEILGIDNATRSTLHDRLYTAGDLLRMGGLAPEPRKPGADAESEVQLFR